MQQHNSYTLETLDGDPIDGVFIARCLHMFHPREGTKLAFEEPVRENGPDEDDEEEMGVRQDDRTGLDGFPMGIVMRSLLQRGGGTCVRGQRL